MQFQFIVKVELHPRKWKHTLNKSLVSSYLPELWAKLTMLHAKWERRQIIGCFSILAENQGSETVMDRDEVYASCFHFAVAAGRTEGLGLEERKTVYVKRKSCSKGI